MKLKFCVDCNYCNIKQILNDYTEFVCTRVIEVDLVTGKETKDSRTCKLERKDDLNTNCGTDAKYFVKKSNRK